MRSILASCVVAAGVAVAASANAQSLELLSENYPPYNWEDDTGIHGFSVDMLAEIFERTGYPGTIDDIQILPWARAYDRTLNEPNTVLFATTRTEAREDLFRWVGPITQTQIAVIVPADMADSITEVSDLEGLRIGTVQDDVGEQLLVEAGLELETFDRARDIETNARKLDGGRVDAIAAEYAVARMTMANLGIDTSQYTQALVLFEGSLYYAFNPTIEEGIIESFQAAVEEIHADGTSERIVANYLQ